jgi:hypothetical protein
VIAVVALAVAGSAAYSVFADSSAVEAQARATACAGRGQRCAPALAKVVRTPFFQEYELHLDRKPVTVRCTRSFVLVGDYSCARRSP